MADFIRIKNTLPSSPKVMRLARELECSQEEALGIMVRWLAWLDMHTEDGKSELSTKEVNSLVFGHSFREYAEALVAIGWAELVDGKVCAVDFDQYCTPTAKKRIASAARQRKHRAKKNNEKH